MHDRVGDRLAGGQQDRVRHLLWQLPTLEVPVEQGAHGRHGVAAARQQQVRRRALQLRWRQSLHLDTPPNLGIGLANPSPLPYL
jgi:hypothetical protein